METKKIICLATRQFDGVMGGLERQISSISKQLSLLGYSVHLLYLSDGVNLPHYALFKDVTIHRIKSHSLGKKASFRERIRRQVLFYRTIEEIQPDVTIAFMTGAFFLVRLQTLLLRIPCILSERNSPEMFNFNTTKRRKYIYFAFMYLADVIIVQLDAYIDKYPKFLRNKIVAIPNAITNEENVYLSRIPLRPVKFIFAGRFSFQKQPLLLISAFSKFMADKDDVALYFYGSGELELEMNYLIESLSASQKIKIMGEAKSMAAVYNSASAICLPSLWEGFPNTVLESLNCGRPVLGFKSCDGIPQLVHDGINGWLVEGNDVQSLSGGLERAYLDIKNARLNSTSIQDSVKSFKAANVYPRWQKIIDFLS